MQLGWAYSYLYTRVLTLSGLRVTAAILELRVGVGEDYN